MLRPAMPPFQGRLQGPVFRVFRWVLCVVLLVGALSRVSWEDRVELDDGEEYKLVHLDESGAILEIDGQEKFVEIDRIVKSATDQKPEIQHGIVSLLHRVNIPLFLLAIALWAPQAVLLGIRLKWMVGIQSIRLTFSRSVALTFLGNLYSLALPGLNSGDLVKSYYIARREGRSLETLTTVALDRFLGLACLVALVGLVILVGPNEESTRGLRKIVVLFLAALVVLAGAYMSSPLRRAAGVQRILARLPLRDVLRRVDGAVLACRKAPETIAWACLLSMATQIMAILSVFCAGWSLGIVDPNHPGQSVSAYLIYVPVGWMAAALPISIQGLGVLEQVYIHFFYDVTGLASGASEAFLLASMVRLIQVLWALPGIAVVFWPALAMGRNEKLGERLDAVPGKLAAGRPT